MKRLLTLAGCAALALTLGACGDSKSPTDSDDILSSGGSSTKSSSSKGAESSSSVSEEIPEGARAATLDDLERNMELTDFFGTKAYLATGTKLGLFSIWVPDTAWIAAPSDFEDGVIDFSLASAATINIKGVTDSVQALAAENSTRTIRFIVNEDDQLQYTLDGKKYKDVKSTTVKTTSGIISKGDSLASKKLECTDGDGAEETYYFYDGRYIVENESGEDGGWSAGYYDIHRGKLLMRPLFYTARIYSLFTATVNKDFGIEFTTGKSLTCDMSELEYDEISESKLAQEWDASVDGVDWTFTLGDDTSFELKAYKGSDGVELKKGIWDVYGDNLMLKVTGCLNKGCTTAVKGKVTKFDPKKGFKYAHSDTDKPNIPTEWEVPLYE